MSIRVHATRPSLINVWSGTLEDAQIDLGMVVEEWDDLTKPVLVIEDQGNGEAWVIVGLQVTPMAREVLHLALTGKITKEPEA